VEPTIPGTAGDSQVDCKITSTPDPIWVEITYPDPTVSAAVGDFWTVTADPETSDVRRTVTNKTDQICEAKEAGGLTMLVMKMRLHVLNTSKWRVMQWGVKWLCSQKTQMNQ